MKLLHSVSKSKFETMCATAMFASSAFSRYHEAVKDTNLVATPWSELSSSLGHCREIKFFKPVNLPGLASTRGVKVQRFRRFENIGLVICSSTRLEDVPAADTFSVEDMISVTTIIVILGSYNNKFFVGEGSRTSHSRRSLLCGCRDHFPGHIYKKYLHEIHHRSQH